MQGTELLTLEAFVDRYPWPAKMLERGRPVEWLWHYDLTLDPGELWGHLIDTSRFNRAMGLGRMEFEEREGVLYGATRNGGFLQEWVEPPWDWVAARYLVAIREYSRGFGHYVRMIYQLEPREEGTRLYVYMGFIPRSLFGRVALKIGGPSVGRDYGRVLAEIEASDPSETPAPYRRSAEPLPDAARHRVTAISESLLERKLPERVIQRLIEHIATGDDMDVYRIQLRRLAHEWGMDQRDLLRVALHATRLGLLEMSWDVICPHCRGVRTEAATLSGVPDRGACDVCEIDFATDSENSLEITFHVHPSIRQVPKLYYCSAEPSTKMHIKVQQALEPGEQRELALALAPGRYRLRLRGEESHRILDVVDGEAPGAVVWRTGDEARARLRASAPLSLTLANDEEVEQSFIVEEVHWKDEALRPVHLFNFQEFRDLFSREYLGTDVQLAVGEQTILFTDVVGSTAFYATKGDPAAFMEVKKHFFEIQQEVAAEDGAIVKTIGDAVMATFSSPVAALRAARAIHGRFYEGRQDCPLRVRISLNTGPCIAVKLNANIDYFGSSVNIAAKLQSAAGAGEIAISEATYGAPGVREYLEGIGASAEEVRIAVPAFDELVAHRWCA